MINVGIIGCGFVGGAGSIGSSFNKEDAESFSEYIGYLNFKMSKLTI